MNGEQSPQIETVLQKMQGLETRDFQLWTTTVVIITALAAGVLLFVMPKVLWNFPVLHLEGSYFRQISIGLAVLIVLYNAYTINLRRHLRHTREELIRQLLRAEQAEVLSLVDPLTGVFNRHYLDRIISKETSRADRLGSSLGFLMIDLDEFKSVNTRLGHLTGDRVLKEVAGVLNRTLRRSDVTIRYGGDEFLVAMPDTTEQQAKHVIERLLKEIDHRNLESPIPGYKLSISCGAASYTKGANVDEVLAIADRRMYEAKPQRRAQG